MSDEAQPPRRIQDLPFDQQDALAQRYQTRRDVRTANAQLASVLRQWVTDQTPDYERFNAEGHKGEYLETPLNTLARRLAELGYSAVDIIRLLTPNATPLDYMNTEELQFVHQRITIMIRYFASTPPGFFDKACEMYVAVGQYIRQQVISQTGHAPEEFEPEHDKISGRESAKRFTPTDTYRPTLFDEDQ